MLSSYGDSWPDMWAVFRENPLQSDDASFARNKLWSWTPTEMKGAQPAVRKPSLSLDADWLNKTQV